MCVNTQRIQTLGCLLSGILLLASLACSSDPTVDDSGAPTIDARVDTGARDTGANDTGPVDSAVDRGVDAGPPPLAGPTRCGDEPPAGATLAPDPPAYGGGACPELVENGVNLITSSGTLRGFLLLGPKEIVPGEKLPLIFMWHWLGGSAQSFVDVGQLAEAVEQQRFFAVVPEAKGGDENVTRWPIMSNVDPTEELTFFDDMLACVSAAYPVNKECVSSVGVSAGALWTTILASERGRYLSSFAVASGGSEHGSLRPWGGSKERKMPALVLWGGASDTCLFVNFDSASKSLEQGLDKDGHFIVECVHNCGHAPPPMPAVGDKTIFSGIWDFVLDHPYWLQPGQSWYAQDGLPETLPAWCGVGAGSAKARQGSCPAFKGCPF